MSVVQMLALLAPEGVLLQSEAAQVFCARLCQDGALPLAKVNLDTMDTIDALAVRHPPRGLWPALSHRVKTVTQPWKAWPQKQPCCPGHGSKRAASPMQSQCRNCVCRNHVAWVIA